jgi:hypothetical protein
MNGLPILRIVLLAMFVSSVPARPAEKRGERQPAGSVRAPLQLPVQRGVRRPAWPESVQRLEEPIQKDDDVMIVDRPADVMDDDRATKLFQLDAGTRLTAEEVNGNWIRISALDPQDKSIPRRRRTGWILNRDVTFVHSATRRANMVSLGIQVRIAPGDAVLFDGPTRLGVIPAGTIVRVTDVELERRTDSSAAADCYWMQTVYEIEGIRLRGWIATSRIQIVP